MKKLVNEDIRIKVLKNGLRYTDIAKKMGVTKYWLSKVMAKQLTPDMEQRINIAIDQLLVSQ